MKKIKLYLIPAIILCVFIAIMTSGGILKKSFGKEDNFHECIEALRKNVADENWNEAEINLKKLKVAWSIVEKRVQFSVERNEMNTINSSIARIQGTVAAKDKTSAIIELSEIEGHWDELEK